jgi:hypothetical protein
VTQLVDLLYRFWPECPAVWLVGDRGFDVESLHRDLEERYGIHLVTPIRNAPDTSGGTDSIGVPTCSCAGSPKAMAYKQAEYFWDADKRRAHGIAPGEWISTKENKAGHRWHCRDCGATAATRFWRSPRFHGYLPHAGEHPTRIALRIALLLRRNAAESVFSQVKHRGVDLRGSDVPRWVSSDNQMAWLVAGCYLGLTLRRLAHETGLYRNAHDEAVDRGLVKITGRNGWGRDGLAPMSLAA